MKFRSVDQIGPEHVGLRVTIRRKRPEGGYSDVVGVAEHIDEASVTVRDRGGRVIEIQRGEIAAARVIEAP